MAREAIFIGYRREDTRDVAGRIYDALEQRFGRDRLFKDVDSLRPGADFGEHIKALLPRCRVALILIGPNWLNALDEDGRRRLDDPHDWVRVEIETALAAGGLDVVPVLVNGARMPRASELPESLHPLLRRHAATIRPDPDFRDDIDRLTNALRASVRTGLLELGALGGDRRPVAPSSQSPGQGNRRPRMIVGAIVAALTLLVAGYGVWRFSSGELASPPEGPVIDEAGHSAAASGASDTVATPPSAESASDAVEIPPPAQPPAASPQQVVQQNAPRESAAHNSSPPAPTTALISTRPAAFDDCDGANWCPPMVRIPGGDLVMGSPSGEANRASNEGPQRQIRIRPFAIGRYEVTFEQWEACAAAGACDLNPQPEDQGWGRGRRPVINVSWNDAQQYLRWLSARTGRAYRLPTEAEWEFAARAGTQTRYSTGDTISAAQARYGAPSSSPVGQFPPNALGLHDVHGNAWEWVQDCFENSLANVPADGSAVEGGRCERRVLRGGSWDSAARSIRSAVRYGGDPGVRGAVRGFRVAADVR